MTEDELTEDVGRRRYLDLQTLARRVGRNTQELLTMFALEGLLARLAQTEHARRLVLKGGMLLAAFDQRRPNIAGSNCSRSHARWSDDKVCQPR